ncbi:MAG: hypothetical protein IPN90_05555 [Elusimicrobia bacterium]|nr:hypothetical protein [Elusimicrobiota bacterium]
MRFIGGLLLLVGMFSGCKKDTSPEVRADNTATRYAAGLVRDTEKAKMSTEKANQAIASTQAEVDKMAQEVQ